MDDDRTAFHWRYQDRIWAYRLVLATLLALLTSAAVAQGCASRFQFNFSGGERGCLTDYSIADDSVPGWIGTLRRLVPNSGNFNLAISPRSAQCSGAIGFAMTTVSGAQLALSSSAATRSARALAECNQRNAKTPGAPSTCACRIVIEDGQSPLTRSEFASLVNAPGVPDLAAVQSPPKPSTDSPAPAQVPLQAPGPGRSSDELAAIRQQLTVLEQQLAKRKDSGTDASSGVAPVRLRARALVVGNGNYAYLGTLPNPTRDARAVAAKLQHFGIEVDLVLDADRSALVRALAQYQARATGYDVNILFYAGHGLQLDGINYVVPVDMVATGVSAGLIKLNTVSLNDALEYLPARTRVVFLDACRDNPLSRSLRATRGNAAIGLAPVNTSSGTLVAYATKDGSTAEDGTGRNSPYTSALLQHLDAEEDIAIVLRRVREGVLKATGNRQEPWEYGSLIGDRLVLSRLAR